MHKICILTLLVLCLTGSAPAQRTVYVDGSVTITGDGTQAAPFQTITEALALPSVTILVAGGIYTSETPYTDILSDQTLIGSYDSSFTTSDPSATPTIIDMGGRSQLDQRGTFFISATGWTIENLIIQNSTTGEYEDTENGGAIYVRNGSNGTFRGVTFLNCAAVFEGGVETGTAREGGAVCIRDASTVVFEDCIFDSCTAVGGGGAVRIRSPGSGNNVKFHRCLFTRCGARREGSVIDDGDGVSQVEIVNCIFANNGVDVAVPSGTAPSAYLIRVSDRRVLIYNCTFVGNSNPAGYMFNVGNSSNAAATKEIVNCIVANNTLGSDGPGVAIFSYPTGYDDATTIQNNLFFSNSGLDPLDPAGLGVIGVNGNITGEPQFVDAANGDYHLKAGSPGMDAGKTLTLVTDDFDGTARPAGAAYDIGAMEGLGSLDPFFFKVQDIMATASSSVNAGLGPENTVNGSGIVNDLHSTVLTDMWLSGAGVPGSVWIKYQFDNLYKLNQMWVWNSNTALEPIVGLGGLGVKAATIEYSTDDAAWTALADVPEFAQAPGTADYAHNTIVDFGGAAAKFVRITCNSSWGSGNQYSLSEVRFFYIPVAARDPHPANGAAGVSTNVTLSWKAGQEAAEHNVYISGDEQAVIDGTASVATVSQAAYGPLSLDLASTYYWRVDEVNNANNIPVWEGSIWSFKTSEYLVVDDFESYNDIPSGQEGSKLVYETWDDGYVDPPAVRTNGSTIGYDTGASMATATKHGGLQSVPLLYNNTSVSRSEVTVDPGKLAVGRDWTVGSPAVLTLWFYGELNNPATDRMYVKVNAAKVIYDGNISQAQWQKFSIDLATLGINLNNVMQLAIGIERIGTTGGSGKVFIDDIRLYAPAAVQ